MDIRKRSVIPRFMIAASMLLTTIMFMALLVLEVNIWISAMLKLLFAKTTVNRLLGDLFLM